MVLGLTHIITAEAGAATPSPERGLRAPADPPGGAFAAVSVTSSYACGLTTHGSIHYWGAGTLGRADPPEGSFTQISVGRSYDGSIECWGPAFVPSPEFVQWS